MSDSIIPKDHREAVAIFRAAVIGPLTARDLEHGELKAELRHLSAIRYRPPGTDHTRRYRASTLERWYYTFQKHGLEGLKPRRRKDRGYAKALTAAQKELLKRIAGEHLTMRVSTIRRTLIAEGLLDDGTASLQTIRRLLADDGLSRSDRKTASKTTRRRWQAGAPDQLWHADVCHGLKLDDGNKRTPLRVHALLDDFSRYVVSIRAFSTEKEVDMLELMVQALRQYSPPKTLYLDNGATYRGDTLKVACARLGTRVVHAQPYDPQARGKMERFWRTLREGCLDHLQGCTTLHDVQVRLLAFLNQHYHRAPHSGLVGRTPGDVYRPHARLQQPVSEKALHDALTVRGNRRVLRDGTVSVGGIDWEVVDGFLANQRVTIARSLFDPKTPPWIEYKERRFSLRPVNPIENGKKPRPRAKRPAPIDVIPFDPAGALLNQMLGRRPDDRGNS